MATEDEIALMRRLLNEPDDTNGWTDEAIEQLIDGTLNADGTFDSSAAGTVGWRMKAASTATLVDISENGSSRSMNQEFRNAIELAKLFGSGKPGDETGTEAARPLSMPMRRPRRGE